MSYPAPKIVPPRQPTGSYPAVEEPVNPPRGRLLLIGAAGRVASAELDALRADGHDCVLHEGLAGARERLVVARPELALLHGELAWAAESEARDLVATLARQQVPTALLVTTKSPAEMIESAFAAGVDDCVLLPLKPSQIRGRLAALQASNPAATQRVHVRADQPSAYAEALAEHLELNGYDVGVTVAADETPGEPADLTVVCWDDPVRFSRALLPAPGEARIVVTSLPRPATPVPGIAAWLDRATTPVGRVLTAVNSHFRLACRDLRADQRIPFFCPIEFREWGTLQEGEWQTGYSYGLSPGGLFIRTLAPARRKVAVEMRIHLTTTGEEFPATGVATWSNCWVKPGARRRTSGMGVQFLGMPLSKRLLNLIQACRAAA